MTVKVLLDTDIGSDIDDAVCLAYLLAQPACELLGITTVTGEADKRAMLADALCKVAGKPVPIYPGAQDALLIAGWQQEAPQAAALTKWPHADSFPRGEAVEFLRRTIRAHPGEITLLTIGPLTNIALLFAVDPDIPALLKAVVTMGGGFAPPHDGYAEWNIALDPHAAAMVASATAHKVAHTWVGLDVTTQVVMDADAVRERFAGHALLRPVLDFAEVWFTTHPTLTFHDPLAAALLFDPAICGTAAGMVGVDVEMQPRPGRTVLMREQAAQHTVAETVDAGRFFAAYFSVFGEA